MAVRNELFANGGEMGALMRSYDWSKTSIGSMAEWSHSLRTALSICLNSHFPMAIWWGREFAFLYNDACRVILGLKHPQALGRSGREVWGERWDNIEPHLQTVISTGQAIWAEDLPLTINRAGRVEEAYFTCSYSPIVSEAGEVQGVFTAITETTQRVVDERRMAQLQATSKQNEIRLQEHQRLLQQVTDTVPGILYVYDLVEQRNIYVNNQVSELLGYTTEQVQAMGVRLFLELAHPDDLAKFPRHVQQFGALKDGEVLENEYRLRNTNGEWRWFSGREIVFSRNANGLPKQILGAAHDITARKRAEEALHLEKERFELAAAAVDCLIYDWNIETQTVERSEGLTRIFGYSPEDTKPTSSWWMERVHPDDVQSICEQVAAALETRDRYSIEYRIRNKCDQYLDVLDQGFIVRDSRGKAVRVVGITTDISDRKITERLQQFLIELNDILRTLNDPHDITWAVVHKVVSYFNITRCSYCEIDAKQGCITVTHDFCRGEGGPLGDHAIAAFGSEVVSVLNQGRLLAIDDVQTDSRTAPYQDSFAAIDTRALLCIPLFKQERFVALFILRHAEPRSWSSEEIVLMEEVAERTWLALDKARTEQALRESEARFQRLATNVPGVICRYLLYANGPERMPYISPSSRSLFELEPETVQQDVGALWALIHPEDIYSLREIIAVSAQTQQPIHWEGRLTLPSGRTRWIQFVARPEKQLDGAALWDGIFTDITWTKEVEIEREHLLIRSQQ